MDSQHWRLYPKLRKCADKSAQKGELDSGDANSRMSDRRIWRIAARSCRATDNDNQAMTTRIRAIRRLRRLTLQDLADKVGTTPQTIQRLETGKMTVSVDWLTRIAKALDLAPATLLDGTPGISVRFVGEIVSDGLVETDATELAPIIVAVPAADPMAVRVKTRLGPHESGTILIVSRLTKSDRTKADGRDCLVELADGSLLFRRIVLGKGGPAAFVPYDDRRGVERDLDIVWFAPVVMSIRYLTDQKP